MSNLTINSKMIKQQIESFKKGTQYLNLIKPATINDGIKQLSKDDLEKYIEQFNTECTNKSICKFVPASGAATRMFKDLYTYLDTQEITDYIQYFIEHIEKFAFYEDLKEELLTQEHDIKELIRNKDYKTMITCLLSKDGLSYGLLPKGLLAFHKSKETFLTPIDEHIKEAKAYAGKNPELVFTVSEQFSIPFEKKVREAIQKEQLENVKYSITYQKAKTDTIAVDKAFNPIKGKNGNPVFRPGGHGSLIENLNEIESDLIFIKNIDNVAIDYYLETTIKYKKALSSILLENQSKIFDFLNKIDESNTLDKNLESEINLFINENLGIKTTELSGKIDTKKIAYYKSILERPIRVCGMVKNEGEPGGGPFWVKNKEGNVSLQIVENSQIDKSITEQKSILESSTHFNPVDLVCGVINKNGQKYDLTQFIDKDTYFIAEKSYQGRDILALEHPGLWNGAMANWNTIFTEVPLETFNPVKQVNDLLKETHQKTQ